MLHEETLSCKKKKKSVWRLDVGFEFLSNCVFAVYIAHRGLVLVVMRLLLALFSLM